MDTHRLECSSKDKKGACSALFLVQDVDNDYVSACQNNGEWKMQQLIAGRPIKRRERSHEETTERKADNNSLRYGWKIDEWCQATRISRSKFYILMNAKVLRTAKLGKSRIILTDPRAFLENHEE
jgi:hypothetical protein